MAKHCIAQLLNSLHIDHQNDGFFCYNKTTVRSGYQVNFSIIISMRTLKVVGEPYVSQRTYCCFYKWLHDIRRSLYMLNSSLHFDK